MDNDGLDKLAQDKRASRKFINKYDFFLADTKLMPLVGKSLGQLLGPRGKMPTPVPFNAPIESFLSRFKTSIRVRVKNSLSITCKVGDVTMDEHQVAGNAIAVINNLSAKLPNGNKNIRKYMIKTTMGKAIKLEHKVTK
jgi:large subunit ribosomal protein L1